MKRKDERKESTTRVKKVHLSQVMGARIQTATVEVFSRFDVETLDLDALSFFVLQHFTLSVENFKEISNAVRDYIVDNFAVTQGEMRRKQDNHLRHLLITYVAPKPDSIAPKPTAKGKASIRPIRPSVKIPRVSQPPPKP